jgi:hypothetical protein
VDPRHLLATVASMANESIEDGDRQTTGPNCSVCGAQATGLREDGLFDFEGRPMVEIAARLCSPHGERGTRIGQLGPDRALDSYRIYDGTDQLGILGQVRGSSANVASLSPSSGRDPRIVNEGHTSRRPLCRRSPGAPPAIVQPLLGMLRLIGAG